MTEQEKKSLLDCPLFRGLSLLQVTAALEGLSCGRQTYPKGAQIYGPNAFDRKLGILLKGTVTVTKGELPVSRLGPGELFGAAALYNREPDYVNTLTAASDCEVIFLTQAEMDERLAAQPLLARNYIAYLSHRIRFLSGKVKELAGPTAEERVLRYLAAQQGQEGTCPDCSRTELAGRLGMSRASLYRVLEALEKAGTLRRTGKYLYLTQTGKDEIK